MKTIINKSESWEAMMNASDEISSVDLAEFSVVNVPFIQDLLWQNSGTIPQAIINAYFEKGKRAPIDMHFIEAKLEHSSGKYWNPFSVSVFGSYPPMNDWNKLLHYRRIAAEGRSAQFDHLQISFELYTKKNLLRLFKLFAEGFKNGYENFITDKVFTKNSLSKSDGFKVQKICDFIQKTCKTYCEFKITSDKVETDKLWYRDGTWAGYDYKAWMLIFDNSSLFKKYFEQQRRSEEENNKSDKTKNNKEKKANKNRVATDNTNHKKNEANSMVRVRDNSNCLTFKEGCQFLGLSESFVYKLTSQGILPFSKPNGKKIYFDKVELQEWMLSRKTKGYKDIQQDATTYVSLTNV